MLEFFEEIENILVRSPVLPKEPPWHQNPFNDDTALIHCGSEQENPNLLRSLALEKKTESYKKMQITFTRMHLKL